MSHKRKHVEILEKSSTDKKSLDDHRSFKPGGDYRQGKHQKQYHVCNSSDQNTSINALKSRIRNLKRLLAHVEHVENHKMSAVVRIERERELEACEHELVEKVVSSKEIELKKKMIARYHRVRFFDRQKAIRALKRLRKVLSDTEDENERIALELKIHDAEVSVNYTMYYPLMKPYSSLYPKSKKEESEEMGIEDQDIKKKYKDSKDGPKRDEETWRAVEKAMKDGTLEALRDSNKGMPSAHTKKSPAKTERKTKKEEVVDMTSGVVQPMNRRERRALERQKVEESGDDDGFFE